MNLALFSTSPQTAEQSIAEATEATVAAMAAGVRAEQRRLSEKGIVWVYLDDDDRMVWVHPDGARRNGPEPTADLIS